MKKFVLAIAVLGFGLICLQQKSFAEKKTDHAEYNNMAIKECNACHKAEGISLNHDADFVRGHRVLASKSGNNCSQCHEQKWCLDCHKGGGTGDDLSQSNFGRDYKPKSHRSDFIAIHPLKSKDNPQQCYRCHDAVAFCNACHSRFPQGNLRIKSHLMSGANRQAYAFGDHATEARRNLQSCQTCHPEGDVCIQCHRSRSNNPNAPGGGVRPHPRSWKSGNMKDRINENMCRKCHVPGTF